MSPIVTSGKQFNQLLAEIQGRKYSNLNYVADTGMDIISGIISNRWIRVGGVLVPLALIPSCTEAGNAEEKPVKKGQPAAEQPAEKGEKENEGAAGQRKDIQDFDCGGRGGPCPEQPPGRFGSRRQPGRGDRQSGGRDRRCKRGRSQVGDR